MDTVNTFHVTQRYLPSRSVLLRPSLPFCPLPTAHCPLPTARCLLHGPSFPGRLEAVACGTHELDRFCVLGGTKVDLKKNTTRMMALMAAPAGPIYRFRFGHNDISHHLACARATFTVHSPESHRCTSVTSQRYDFVARSRAQFLVLLWVTTATPTCAIGCKVPSRGGVQIRPVQ